ncbi:LemA family protein [Actinomadura sp. ATCC 31491]|uniref:LemA family protein n=2 Tax=Actinomadura luzonensis TaxID=2805427 RepID=A0ABT0FWK5_9ACTN|nr:LemA family protein [Actinomadura luzonensis]MCK2216724.1 LemA family protein [Actinomadura luzonensis]
MTSTMVVLVAGLVAVLLAVYVSWRAGRLDRLHIRLELARESMDAALTRRRAVVLELAGSRLLDPATSLVLAAAAHEARIAGPEEREHAESDLSRALRAAVDQDRFREKLAESPGGADLLEELDAAVAKVVYARRFYNNAVAVTRAAQRRWLARVLRLAGHTEFPQFFEIDDNPPATMATE